MCSFKSLQQMNACLSEELESFFANFLCVVTNYTRMKNYYRSLQTAPSLCNVIAAHAPALSSYPEECTNRGCLTTLICHSQLRSQAHAASKPSSGAQAHLSELTRRSFDYLHVVQTADRRQNFQLVLWDFASSSPLSYVSLLEPCVAPDNWLVTCRSPCGEV